MKERKCDTVLLKLDEYNKLKKLYDEVKDDNICVEKIEYNYNGLKERVSDRFYTREEIIENLTDEVNKLKSTNQRYCQALLTRGESTVNGKTIDDLMGMSLFKIIRWRFGI